MAGTPASSIRGGFPLGLPGATAATRYVGATASGAPATGTFAVGDFCIDRSGAIYVCTVAGTPGTWVAIGGSSALTSGQVKRTAADVSTTSTTFVDLTGASITITTGAHRVLLIFSGEGDENTADAYTYLDMVVDGVNVGGTQGMIGYRQPSTTGGKMWNASFSYLTDVLTAAAHTFKVQWRVTAGTGTIYASAAAPYVFSAIEQAV